jgi:hypothetical protein
VARFAYIDETGHTGLRLDDPRQPILTLVAVIVPEDQVQALGTSIRELTTFALGWLPRGIEVHGQELWSGTGPWKSLSHEQRIALYTEALELLETHHAYIAHASINKPRLSSRYPDPANPYLLALQFLCQKINDWPARSAGPIVLIADESKENELRAIEMVADLQSWGPGVVGGPRLGMIIDTLHFVRSPASPGVQMADLVAFIIHRQRLGQERHPLAAEGLDRLLSTVTDRTATWREEWPAR